MYFDKKKPDQQQLNLSWCDPVSAHGHISGGKKRAILKRRTGNISLGQGGSSVGKIYV